MRRIIPPTWRIRVFLSICAAAIGSLVCQALHHFTLSLANPRGFTIMLHHRCGKVFLLALLWMTFETLGASSAAALRSKATTAAPPLPQAE